MATQLASVKILPIAGEDQIIIRATATFTTRSFTAGNYNVDVGINQALLRLDHPSFECENAYQAILPKERWSESWKNIRANHVWGKAKAKIGFRLFGVVGATGEGEADKDKRQSAEQQASARYPLISAMPSGWRIGTELGDPRAPHGTLPKGLEHCLNGEYFSGKRDEQGEGYKDSSGTFTLCVLKPNVGGNDPEIVATLFGVTGSLKIVVTPSAPANVTGSALESLGESRNREIALRQAFVDICIERAQLAQSEGAQTEAMLSGEIYLNHQTKLAPKLSQKPATDAGKKGPTA